MKFHSLCNGNYCTSIVNLFIGGDQSGSNQRRIEPGQCLILARNGTLHTLALISASAGSAEPASSFSSSLATPFLERRIMQKAEQLGPWSSLIAKRRWSRSKSPRVPTISFTIFDVRVARNSKRRKSRPRGRREPLGTVRHVRARI